MNSYEEKRPSPYGSVVLITGASSGIGKSTAFFLKDYGFHVYGVSRYVDFLPAVSGYEGGFFKSLQMDVRDENSVKNTVELILKHERKIDILINCAAIGTCGAVEHYTDEDIDNILSTNFYGYVHTIRALLPGMRANQNGLIINVGSVAGIFAIPFQPFYCVSKFSLEALTQSLRMEVAEHNIKATLISPGGVKTGFTKSRQYVNSAKTNNSYDKLMHDSVTKLSHEELNGMDPDKVAKAIYNVTQKPNPPIRTVVGAKYKAFVFLKRILPDRLIEYIMKNMY